jgi:hypothetical protein
MLIQCNLSASFESLCSSHQWGSDQSMEVFSVPVCEYFKPILIGKFVMDFLRNSPLPVFHCTAQIIHSIGFWRWCITHRINRFSDFVDRLDSDSLESGWWTKSKNPLILWVQIIFGISHNGPLRILAPFVIGTFSSLLFAFCFYLFTFSFHISFSASPSDVSMVLPNFLLFSSAFSKKFS